MRLFWIIAVFAFASDQLSKYGALAMLSGIEGDRLEIFPPLLVFMEGFNTGINFGLLADAPSVVRWGLVALAAGVAIWIAWYARRYFERPVLFACGGLLAGGALGNALDRLLYGGVIDFLNMSCCGITNPYVFNLADVWVVAGAIGLVVFADSGSKQA